VSKRKSRRRAKGKRPKAIRVSGDADLSKLATSLGSFSLTPLLFGDFKIIKCPDGTPVAILKNLDKAFPRFAADWTATLGATFERLKGLEAKLGVDVKQRVVKIYDNLGTVSSDLAQNYRTNYAEFATRPCEKESVEILRKTNEKVRKATFILRTLQIEAEKDKPDLEELEGYISQLMKEMQ